MSKQNRKQYLINPGFQLRFIASTLVLVAISFLVLYGANQYLTWKLWQIGESLALSPGHPFFAFVQEQKRLTLSIFLLSGLTITVFIFFGGLFLSHRIAGPIQKMGAQVDEWVELTAGPEKLTEIRLRKKDFFPELADSLNRLASRIRNNPTSKL